MSATAKRAELTRQILAHGRRNSDAEDALWMLVCAIVAAARRFDTTPQAMAALALVRLPQSEEWQQEVSRLADEAEQEFSLASEIPRIDLNLN